METNLLNPTISLGSIIAIVISWSLNKSVFWVVFHGICGWLYVFYYLLGNKNNDNLKINSIYSVYQKVKI